MIARNILARAGGPSTNSVSARLRREHYHTSVSARHAGVSTDGEALALSLASFQSTSDSCLNDFGPTRR